MKAMAQRSWAFGEAMTLVELPDPIPGPRDVRVRVRACGVNPVDWKMRERGPLRVAARVIGPPAPIVVGIDFMGLVDAVGAEVKAVAVGDRVAGGTMFSRRQRGSMADTVCVREDQLVKVPDGVSDDVAGALAVVGATAKLSLIDQGKLPVGGRVLVLGAAGGVGQLVIGLARFLKDAEVSGVCSAKNIELVRSLGCADAIDYGAGDPLAAAAAVGPFDVVVDCAGGYDGGRCRELLRPGGRHAIVAGESPAAFVGAVIAPLTSRLILGVPSTANLRPVMDGLAAGAFTIAVAERLPLTALEDAHARSRTGRLTGKLVMLPQS